MSEQEQFEQWLENDTKGLDKASARAGWIERMASESAEIARLREENALNDLIHGSKLRERLQRIINERDHLRAKTAVSCGVGDGSGSLIVYGDYDSIKRVQAMVFELEKLRAQLEAAQRQEPVADVVLLNGEKVIDGNLAYMESAKLGDRLYAAPVPARVVMPEGCKEALIAAKQFIRNGIDLGYILMPDKDTPDSAHETLPMIEAAISRLNAVQQEGGDHD